MNLWLKIPAEDYERHMSSPGVGQSKLISDLFAAILDKYTPSIIAVPGCATGNGFEKINWNNIRSLDAIDINPKFLEIAKTRFAAHAEKIRLRCMDLEKDELEPDKYDLIFAALIFEYVSPEALLPKFHSALKENGILAVLLQLESKEHTAVSKTKYKSLEKLGAVIKLHKEKEFDGAAKGYKRLSSQNIKLPSGKEFLFLEYQVKNHG